MRSKILILVIGMLIAGSIVSCDSSFEPESPSIKGVFLSTKTIPSVYDGRKAIISRICIGENSGPGPGGYKYVQGADILVEGRKYKFYLDSSRHVDIGIFDTENKSWSDWIYFTKNSQVKDERRIYIEHLDLNFGPDSISPELYGYSYESNLFFFMEVISDARKVLKPYYYTSIRDFEFKEFGHENLYSTIRIDYGFDVSRQVLYLDGDSLTSGKVYDDRVREIGETISKSAIIQEYLDEIVRKHFRRNGKNMQIPSRYISEYVVEPGDSVWFTGRISGDSVIAYK